MWASMFGIVAIRKSSARGGITAEHHVQPKNTPQKREKDPWSCANSNPNKIPPPIPPPPWAKVQAQPLGRPALCPGGRGNGRGNSTRPTPSHTQNETSPKTEKNEIAHNLP